MLKEKAKITSKGQVTIPKKVREKFSLETGTEVIFREENGQVKIEPVIEKPLEELKKIRENIKPIPAKELNQMIEEARKAWDRFG